MDQPPATATMQGAECLLVELDAPGRPPVTAGVLLRDPGTDRVWLRLRRDWEEIAGEEDLDILELLEDDLASKALEMGGEALFSYLEENASNFLRASGREEIAVEPAGFERRLDRLYREHVAPRVLPFRTHLPVYSLRAAAGRLGAETEVENEGWEEVRGLRLTPEMFLARVTGRSMEPRIPDGSLCVFRYNVTGSRQGKLLLIQHFGHAGTTAEFTVKRYRSVKSESEEGWRHERIVLEPLNPEFEPWELAPEEFQVVAEFAGVHRAGGAW